MKIGIAGSRSLDVSIPSDLIPDRNISMIYTGGAVGIDRSVRELAAEKGVKITEILPEYELYGKYAPLVRNELIVRLSDMMYIFWDGKSRGTENVISLCKEKNKPYKLFLWKSSEFILIDNSD